jgi:uncharacterized protein (UPF0333 family)
MNTSKNRPGFAMIMVIFLIILIGTVFVLITSASNTIVAQTNTIYKNAVKSNQAASEAQLGKSLGRSRIIGVSR